MLEVQETISVEGSYIECEWFAQRIPNHVRVAIWWTVPDLRVHMKKRNLTQVKKLPRTMLNPTSLTGGPCKRNITFPHQKTGKFGE